jgi:toxin YoeB
VRADLELDIESDLLSAGVEDYTYWQDTDPKLVRRINQLLKDIIRITLRARKAEPLKHTLRGYWSRRIDAEIESFTGREGAVWVAQLRFHYGS